MFILHFKATDAAPPRTGPAGGPLAYDFQPALAGFTKPGTDCILREEDARDYEVVRFGGCENVAKMFVKPGGNGGGPVPADLMKEFEEALDEGDVRLTLSLARIYFGRGMSEPFAVDYVDHVLSRSRIADRIVVAGYTDDDCTMAESAVLGMRRAHRVRRTLVNGGADVQVFTVSRPKSGFAPDERYSRRVEVSAVFGGLAIGERLGSAADKEEGAVKELVHAVNGSRAPIRSYGDLARVLESAR